jgi:uncharacterized SAM-binding protein YcdF (DUF218 family)|tara:strand:- start:7504 stop:8280 length:777 start_codon:yes stop_codon:yes gene_type:complete
VPDWITLSKFLPQLVYPFNLALLLLLAALALIMAGRRRSGVFAVFVAFAVLVVCASPLSLMLYREHELQYPPVPVLSSPTADAIVLLGGDVGIPVPPRTQSQLHGNRLLHAFRLFKAGKAPLIMVTGGNVFPQEGLYAEASYSKTILTGWGVPDDVIVTESKSRNTRQNALYSHQILAAQGVDRILLVTNAFHMPRAAAVFGRAGFEVVPSPSSFSITDYRRPKLLDWWPSLGNLGKAQAVMREKLGLLVYRLRGWTE